MATSASSASMALIVLSSRPEATSGMLWTRTPGDCQLIQRKRTTREGTIKEQYAYLRQGIHGRAEEVLRGDLWRSRLKLNMLQRLRAQRSC